MVFEPHESSESFNPFPRSRENSMCYKISHSLGAPLKFNITLNLDVWTLPFHINAAEASVSSVFQQQECNLSTMGQVTRVPQNGDSFPWYIDIQNGYKKNYIYIWIVCDLCDLWTKRGVVADQSIANQKRFDSRFLSSLQKSRFQVWKASQKFSKRLAATEWCESRLGSWGILL